MSYRHLPRYRPELDREIRAKLDRVIEESVDLTTTVARATLSGDRRRLRGIPAVGRGVGGTSPGTDPLAAAMRLRSDL